MSQYIDLYNLLPDIFSLYPSSFTSGLTSIQLSTIFVLFLCIVCIGFLLYARIAYRKSKKRTQILQELLSNETPDTLKDSRLDLLDNEKKGEKIIKHLWSEFDESLIEARERHNANNTRLYNTLDSNHFFNTSTLAPEITENRTLAAVPGFLTGLGVLGTFIGLQLGLSELHIGNDVAVEEMRSGLAQVISGAKIAFLTSVWGVGLSLLFNFIEKMLERNARTNIAQLQRTIDHLFPRLTPESQLQKIAENSAQSKEDLKYFAEQIGNSLQTTVREFGERIDNTIGGFAKGAGSANQDALESLVHRFLEEFGAVGGQQAEEMRQANERFSNTLNSLDASMTVLLKQLEENQTNSVRREQELIKNMSDQVDQLVTNSNKQQALLTDTIDKKLSELLNQFNNQHESATEREKEREAGVSELLNRLETSMEAQLKTSKQLIEQGEKLQNGVTASIQGSIEASSRMKESAGVLNEASQHMKGTGRFIEQAGQHIANSITEATTSTRNLALENQTVIQTLNSQQKLLNDQQQRFNENIQQMTAMFDTAENTFDLLDEKQQHFLKGLENNINNYATQLADHVNTLSSALGKMLTDYTEQVDAHTEERLEQWVENTTTYTTAMQGAIESLGRVVEDIEDVVKNIRGKVNH